MLRYAVCRQIIIYTVCNIRGLHKKTRVKNDLLKVITRLPIRMVWYEMALSSCGLEWGEWVSTSAHPLSTTKSPFYCHNCEVWNSRNQNINMLKTNYVTSIKFSHRSSFSLFQIPDFNAVSGCRCWRHLVSTNFMDNFIKPRFVWYKVSCVTLECQKKKKTESFGFIQFCF